MNKTFDLLVELRNRGALLISVGAAGVVVTAAALYAYGRGAPASFPNLWSSIVIVLFGIFAVVIYAIINVALLRNQQTLKRDVVRAPLQRVLAPLGALLIVIALFASMYKHSAMLSYRLVDASNAQAKGSRLSPEEDLLQACKSARTKVYMARGYSLLDADKAAYLECATSNDKTALLIQSLTGAAPIATTSTGVGRQAGVAARPTGYSTLRDATASEWAAASSSDQLATSVDFVRAVGGANGDTDMQSRATELSACITEAVSGSLPPSLMAKDVAAACMVMLGYK